MNDSFLCPDKVRKISVASYMWFFDMILECGSDMYAGGWSRVSRQIDVRRWEEVR